MFYLLLPAFQLPFKQVLGLSFVSENPVYFVYKIMLPLIDGLMPYSVPETYNFCSLTVFLPYSITISIQDIKCRR